MTRDNEDEEMSRHLKSTRADQCKYNKLQNKNSVECVYRDDSPIIACSFTIKERFLDSVKELTGGC